MSSGGGLNSLAHRVLTKVLGRPPSKGERDELKAGIAELVQRKYENVVAELRRQADGTGDIVRRAAFMEAADIVSRPTPALDDVGGGP